ncbi:MAG TPA: TonB-dependent receptor, partial [Candidatus Solibacter sp.]|nr:TonB-dependent receptor [Candidatus Solibacter sp.]
NHVPVVSVRADQNWNNRHHSFVSTRWSHLNQFTGDTFGIDNILAGTHAQRVARSIGLDHVVTLKPSMILDVKYTLNRFEEPSFSLGAGFDPTKLGFPASWVSRLQKPSFPYITVSGYASFGTTQADGYNDNTHHVLTGNLTQVHGKHMMRYGGEFWILQEARGGVGNQGQFDFNGTWTRLNNINSAGPGDGSALASLLLGMPTGGNLPVNANAVYSQHFVGFFVQDDWRVTPRLTVNLGLRWDYERPVMERFNRLTDRYDPATLNPISPAAQAAYAAILSSPANATNQAVQLAAQLAPASAFRVPGVLGFAGLNGVPRTAVNGDYREFQPRLGFAYQIDRNTVIRGGFGRFTQAGFSAGGQVGFSTSANLNATQDNFLTPYDTLANPFRAGIAAPTGSSLGALTNLGQGIGTWDNPDLGRLHSLEWSLHLQRQVRTWLFEIGYSHNKTYDIWNFGTWDKNLQSFALWKQLQTPTFNATGKPVATLDWNLTLPNPFYQLPGVSTNAGTYSSRTISLNQLLRPNPLYGSIGQNNPSGSNQYDAGLAKIVRRFSKGYSVIAAFTWSKLFEDTSFLGPQIAGNHVEHKLGGEDRPFIFSLSPIWEVPVGRGRHFGRQMPKALDYIAGGWELSGNFRIQSGKAVVFSGPAFFCGRDFSISRSERSLNQWFDTSCFLPFPNANTTLATLQAYPYWTGVQSLPGYNYVPVAGDTIRNGVYQDFANYLQTYPTRWGDVRASRVNNVDLGLRKNVKLTEKVKLQLRGDAFNAFNHPRFGGPDANPSDAAFGVVAKAQNNQPRGIELGVRVSY